MIKTVVQLSSNERIVLQAVQEYLNKNRHLNIGKLVPFITSRFKLASVNINKDGIKINLKSLLQKNLIVEGSKLTHYEILENPKRKLIYDYIVGNPGAYLNKIVDDLGVSNHVAIWHLRTLMEFKFVKRKTINNHEVYFDARVDFEIAKARFLTLKKKSKEIIEFLLDNDLGSTKTQMSKELGMHSNTINKYISALEEIGLVVKKELGSKTLYFIEEFELERLEDVILT
ncbi:MAG: HTH domain-containing protein [Candidatus Lokiarchaeota archaeon]|nr:HTH domain-containing protein [Candidatus Lokiarchaeota archaeon]